MDSATNSLRPTLKSQSQGVVRLSQVVVRSVAERLLVAERQLPEREESSRLEALPYDSGLYDRISATSSAESVAGGWSPGHGCSSMLKALPDDSGLCDEISATSSAESVRHRESVSRRESRSVAVSRSPGQGGRSMLQVLP